MNNVSSCSGQVNVNSLTNNGNSTCYENQCWPDSWLMFQERPATSQMDTAFVGLSRVKQIPRRFPSPKLLLHASHELPQLKLITIKTPILQAAKLSFQIMQISKVKVSRDSAKVALRVPGRLRPQIFSTFGTTRVVVRQPNAPAGFIPGEIPGTHFQRLSRPQGTWFCRNHGKKFQVTPPGIDPGTVRLVAQHLSHYTIPGPIFEKYIRFH